ncbi:ABC transporter permease [Metallumcola ferriviriculae]|uniref:ABC transporter permease n=1 Tax=Metallumcola ferriviriculae TaxID=3039180 RepID=A0AAU0UQF6_9FIRM|nr:ABC transporter permease [Desulfitibacteraceae bacterium MK1]
MAGPMLDPKFRKYQAAFQPRRNITRSNYLFLSVSTFVTLFLAWSALTYTGFIDPLFLPTPIAIMESAMKLTFELNFLHDVWMTFMRVMVGFAAAAIIGIPLGILVGTYKPVEAMVEPLMAFIRYMPASAFIPLFILWIGVNEAEKIAVIWFGSFFQLVLMVAVATKSVKQELLEVSYTLGTSRSAVLWRVLLPASLPAIMDSLRLILGWAWTYVIVAELIGASAGIGHTILQSSRMLRTANILVGILTIGILGLISDYCFKWAHRVFFPWTE